jgi:hypothetical protein
MWRHYSCCDRPFQIATPQVGDKASEAVGPQSDADTIKADIHALHQKLENACLLGWEQFLPHRIKALEGFQQPVGLNDFA